MRKMLHCDKKLIKPSSKDCLNIANNLIKSCYLLVPQVNDVSEINSNLIVLLYEKITGLSVPDLISDKEADNIQSVINTLSLDILQLSLSHISGEAVVRKDTLAIYSLLHVLEGILLHSHNREQAFPRRIISRLKSRKSRVSNERISPPNTISSPLDVERIFEKNVELKLHTTIMKESHSLKCKPFLKERNCLQSSHKSTHPGSCHKSYLLPYTLRKKHSSQPSLKKDSKPKNKSSEMEVKRAHEKKGYDYLTMRSPTHFIQELLHEFPCLKISPPLLKNVENMHTHQLIRMHKLMKKCILEKSKAAVEADNISKRQLKLAEVLKKDLLQQKRLNKVKEERENGRKINYCLRDSRMRSAKMKQYSDEFVLEMRKKMLHAANTAEELLFKRVFKEIMDIQNEHVSDLCQQMREARMSDDHNYLIYLNSLENLYQSQYQALAEEIANERNEAHIRQNAERQALSKIEREFRERLKNEIRIMQSVIVEQTEDCHFREMDANLYIDGKRRQLLKLF